MAGEIIGYDQHTTWHVYVTCHVVCRSYPIISPKADSILYGDFGEKKRKTFEAKIRRTSELINHHRHHFFSLDRDHQIYSRSIYRDIEICFDAARPRNASVEVKNEENDAAYASSPPGHLDLENGNRDSVEALFSENDPYSAAEEDVYDSPSNGNENALVVYDPAANGADTTGGGGGEIVPVPEPIDIRLPVGIQHYNIASRVLPSVGAFTVQCASCFKWRLIPTKEKYEEIREFISENPFYCETAREWRPDISCDDPADIHQDGSRLWAIDKPNIAQAPPGWQRLLRIRAEGGSKFADVYYVAPSGKRLRSMVEIQKYLCQHPESATEGVRPSQFSFQIPRPLQENYVRKRPAHLTSGGDGNHLDMPRLLGPGEVDPLAWEELVETTKLQLGGPRLSFSPYVEAPVFDPMSRPAKKQVRRATPNEMFLNQHAVRLEDPHQSINDSYDV